MRQLILLDSAVADLVGILDHVSRQSGNRAVGRRLVDRLHDQCRRLAALPGTLGRARPELRADIRSTPCLGYVIFFRYLDDTVEIVNILHGRRDLIAYFAQNDDHDPAS